MNFQNILHRLTITEWVFDRNGATIYYQLDGKDDNLVLTPQQLGKYLTINGFILLSVIHDGKQIIRYEKGDKTVAVDFFEFVEDFKLSQYMCLRIVEAWMWNEKAKQLRTNVRAISPMIEGFMVKS